MSRASCADNARRDRAAEAEWVADRQHPVAHPARRAVAERHCVERLVALHLQQRQVHPLVLADQLGLESCIVGEGNGDLVRAIDHVVVGDDVAGGVDDEPAAEADRLATAGPLRAVPPVRAVTVQEVLEELLERRTRRHARTFGPAIRPLLRRRRAAHVHDRGLQLLRQVGKAFGRPGRMGGHWQQPAGHGADDERCGQKRGAQVTKAHDLSLRECRSVPKHGPSGER